MFAIDPRPSTPRAILGNAPKVKKDFPGFLLLRVLLAGVVLAIVMIVPYGDHRHLSPQCLKLRLGSQHFVLGSEDVHVAGIAVDVVSQVDE
jgi:hypothetical protein